VGVCGFGRWQKLAEQLIVQIIPIGIVLFDQRDLPFPAPFLDLFLSSDRGTRVGVLLDVDEPVRLVPRGNAGDERLSMDVDALREVACNPNVDGAVFRLARM
jgi:hypothetical protein